MDVVITGIGLSCSLRSRSLKAALARSSAWQNLLAAKSGIALYQPFPELEPLPLGLIGKKPAQLTNLTEILVAEALEDAGLIAPLPDCGVVIGSSRGPQAALEQLATLNDKNIPQLNSWLETLPNRAAIVAARQIGTTGAVLAPMAACATGIWSIARGFELIRTGEYQRVIAGTVETPVTRLTLAGFDRIGALAKTGCYPFDKHREGLVLAEGGAIFVLESAELALSRGASIYGKILSFGITCDADRVSAPDKTGKSAISAIDLCLQRAGLVPADIDYIHAHGTSTTLNDEHEAKIIQHLFPDGVPVSSTKGATGHTLGASGAIGTAFCLMAIREQILPPCVGLRELAFELDLVTSPRRAQIKRVLCFSFGFGGQNAVLGIGSL